MRMRPFQPGRPGLCRHESRQLDQRVHEDLLRAVTEQPFCANGGAAAGRCGCLPSTHRYTHVLLPFWKNIEKHLVPANEVATFPNQGSHPGWCFDSAAAWAWPRWRVMTSRGWGWPRRWPPPPGGDRLAGLAELKVFVAPACGVGVGTFPLSLLEERVHLTPPPRCQAQ